MSIKDELCTFTDCQLASSVLRSDPSKLVANRGKVQQLEPHACTSTSYITISSLALVIST